MSDSSSGRSRSSSEEDTDVARLVRLACAVITNRLKTDDWDGIQYELETLTKKLKDRYTADAVPHLLPILSPVLDALSQDKPRQKALRARDFKGFTKVKVSMNKARSVFCVQCLQNVGATFYRCETCREHILCVACEENPTSTHPEDHIMAKIRL
jgi:hypothetical protein